MLFLIILQLVVAALIVILVLCQNSGSSVTGAFTSRRSDAFVARGASGLFVKVTWVLLIVFFINTIFLGRLNFSSNAEIIASEVEEGKLKRALETDYTESESTDNAFSD